MIVLGHAGNIDSMQMWSTLHRDWVGVEDEAG